MYLRIERFLAVLEAPCRQFAMEANWRRGEIAAFIDLVSLCNALGGGWNDSLDARGKCRFDLPPPKKDPAADEISLKLLLSLRRYTLLQLQWQHGGAGNRKRRGEFTRGEVWGRSPIDHAVWQD